MREFAYSPGGLSRAARANPKVALQTFFPLGWLYAKFNLDPSVGMTILLQNGHEGAKFSISNEFVIPTEAYPDFPTARLSPATTYAAFRKESRMKSTEATALSRKSGGAQGRDLLFA